MPIFSLSHSPAAWRAEAVIHGATVAALGGYLLVTAPAGRAPVLMVLAALGLLLWSWLEYVLHRFVQHRIQPFQRWHLEHHRRPAALVGLSLLFGASGMALLVVLPAWWLMGGLNTSALSLGLFSGYLGYTLTHHAVHQAAGHDEPPDTAPRDWLANKTVWHVRHHQMHQPCCFGVTTALWDRVFGTTGHPH